MHPGIYANRMRPDLVRHLRIVPISISDRDLSLRHFLPRLLLIFFLLFDPRCVSGAASTNIKVEYLAKAQESYTETSAAALRESGR